MPDPDLDNAAYVREVHDKGLRFDLNTMSRRRMLAVLGGAGAVAVTVLSGAPALADTLEEVESETAGPYPADGSNGPDVRTLDGIVRKDIRSSFDTATGTAEGIPLDFSLTVLDLDGAPIVGAAIYAWHCDRDGNYSLYSTGITDQNYLRGIQVTDSTGTVTFTSIFPACYSGRWPHIHFEVYGSLANATSGDGPIVKTSQIAIPEDVADLVYATDGYSQSVTNLSQVTLAGDNVFGDDSAARELATVTGTVTDGFTATLTVAVDPSGTEESGGGTPPSGSPPSGAPTASPTATATATASATTSATVSPSTTARPSSQKKKKHKKWWNPFSW
ncbi:protocatechuate 3,4-dioxygenase beta subunit [Actinoplanes tereljensis]|uniref:3,4-dioxygenase subunit beta n=1 Tax=Paractinoplanes tereljensis TaxID=571912 RepID=A0A919NGI5_9ACTN|nr:intradiol ring-cleavage dioxygenase [Actinoplanes tereljensis]GIF18038.1 3,4-dioxygenase subunit beta [Actinoplanes tereljensis]